MPKRRFTTVLLVLAALIAGALTQRVSTGATSTPPTSNARARLEAARKVYQGILARQQLESNPQPVDFENLCMWSRRWMDAQRDISDEKDNQLDAIGAHLGRVKELERAAGEWLKVNAVPESEVAALEYHRLQAEYWLVQAKAR